MKRYYLCLLIFITLCTKITCATVVDQIKNWWTSLTQEGKSKVYKGAQEHISNALPPEFVQDWTYRAYTPEYVWNFIVNPAYQTLKKEIGKDVGWVAGAIALGGAAIGLYRWATRRGLGGLIKDFLEKDKLDAKIQRQLTQKISTLRAKKPLSDADKSLAKGLLMLTQERAKSSEQNAQNLHEKTEILKKIIKPSKDIQEVTPNVSPSEHLNKFNLSDQS